MTLNGSFSYSAGASVTLADDTNYNSFPGFCVAPNGDLVAAWRVGTSHIEGNTGIVRKISSDGGATWGAAATVVSGVSFDYGTVTLTTLSDGRIACLTWRRPATGGTPSTGMSEAVRVVFSSDNGSTWGSEVVVTDAAVFDAKCVVEGPIVEEADGGLIVPVWGRDVAYTGDNHSVKLLRSSDGGATWAVVSTIADGVADGKFYNESGVVILPDGRYMAIVRDEDTTAMFRSLSSDKGATWSTPEMFLDNCNGAPKAAAFDLFTGLAYTVQRRKDDFQRGWLVMVGGESCIPLLEVREGATMYAQAAEESASKIGCVIAIESTTSNADVFYVPITVTSR